MKIPETSANVGAYYGNEDNGQWQANGVVVDNGVGGGVVGSGDAGHRPPVYPVHVPRGHIPSGYVMAGAYYPGAAYVEPQSDNFEDYMWMENEEEFDKQVMQQLEEEALMEQCIEAMLEDEQRERQRPVSNGHNHYPTTSNGSASISLEETVSKSKLNPLAAEFVPIRARPPPEETQEVTEVKTEVESAKEVSVQEATERTDEVDSKTVIEESRTDVSETTPAPNDPPEVSAADVQPIDKEKKLKEVKKDTKPKPEVKKIVKTDVKKPKPLPVKSETKAPVKKPVKVKTEVKSEVKDEEAPVAEVKQSTPPPAEDLQPGIKPINYAAAAKANKPKKASSPTAEKSPPVKAEKPKTVEKTDKKPQIKDKVKEKPIVQRKNSAK